MYDGTLPGSVLSKLLTLNASDCRTLCAIEKEVTTDLDVRGLPFDRAWRAVLADPCAVGVVEITAAHGWSVTLCRLTTLRWRVLNDYRCVATNGDVLLLRLELRAQRVASVELALRWHCTTPHPEGHHRNNGNTIDSRDFWRIDHMHPTWTRGARLFAAGSRYRLHFRHREVRNLERAGATDHEKREEERGEPKNTGEREIFHQRTPVYIGTLVPGWMYPTGGTMPTP